MRKGEQATALLNDEKSVSTNQPGEFFPVVAQLKDKDNEISPGCDSEAGSTNSENIHSGVLESVTKAMP
jgi:hypothetical protein